MPEKARYTPSPNILLCFSNLNLPEHVIAAAGVKRLRRIVETIDNTDDGSLLPGGYDITPTRRLIADSFFGLFTIDNPQRRFMSRLHQTWPQDLLNGMLHASSPRGAAINTAAYAIMPETHRSLRTLRRLSHAAGGVPMTVYAEQTDKSGRFVDFSPCGPHNATQLSPEAIGDAIHDLPRFYTSLGRRGIQGVVIDNHHFVRAANHNEDSYIPQQDVFDSLEESNVGIAALHVSAGRHDSTHNKDRLRSQTELAAILQGPDAMRRTRMGEVLLTGYEMWRRAHMAGTHTPLPVTIEVPYRGLVAYRGGGRPHFADFTNIHRDISQSIAEFFT